MKRYCPLSQSEVNIKDCSQCKLKVQFEEIIGCGYFESEIINNNQHI